MAVGKKPGTMFLTWNLELSFSISLKYLFLKGGQKAWKQMSFSFSSWFPVLLHRTPKDVTSSVKRRVFLFCFDFTFYFCNNYRFQRSCKGNMRTT